MFTHLTDEQNAEFPVIKGSNSTMSRAHRERERSTDTRIQVRVSCIIGIESIETILFHRPFHDPVCDCLQHVTLTTAPVMG